MAANEADVAAQKLFFIVLAGVIVFSAVVVVFIL